MRADGWWRTGWQDQMPLFYKVNYAMLFLMTTCTCVIIYSSLLACVNNVYVLGISNKPLTFTFTNLYISFHLHCLILIKCLKSTKFNKKGVIFDYEIVIRNQTSFLLLVVNHCRIIDNKNSSYASSKIKKTN